MFSSAAQPGRLVGPGQGLALSRGVDGAARVEDVEIDGFDYGISAGRLQVRRVVVTGCGKFGIYAETLAATDVTADANLNGIAVNRRVRATALRARDNIETGVDGGRSFVGRDVTVTGNGIWGIDTSAGDGGTGPIVVHGGTVTGNGVDLVSGKRPRLTDTACDHSLHRDDQGIESGSWSVCALD